MACEGPYLVHLADPGINPPNLAAVQEISAGIYRVGEAVTTPEVELWVDDIRLSDPVSQTGTAMSVDARLAASDVGNLSAAYVRQNGQFRQINQDPTYRASERAPDGRQSPAGAVPARPRSGWRCRSRVSLRPPRAWIRSCSPAPTSGATRCPGLRKPESVERHLRARDAPEQAGHHLGDQGLPRSARASARAYTRGRVADRAVGRALRQRYNVNLTYQLQMRRRGFRLPLGGLAGIVPGVHARESWGSALSRSGFSLVPSRVRFPSGLNRDEANSTAFRLPVARSDDRLLRPTLALTHLWRNSGGLTWQPIGMLNLSCDLTSTRDLRVYPDSTPIGRLAYNERRFLLGIPVGVERDRNIVTTLALTPMLTSLAPARGSSATAASSSPARSTAAIPVRVDGDSGAFILPKTLNNSRGNEVGVAVDLGRAFRVVAGRQRLAGQAARPDPAGGREHPAHPHLDLRSHRLRAEPASTCWRLGRAERTSWSRRSAAALGASEARVANLASGADLPLGFSFTLSHALTRTTRFQRVSGSFIPTETSSASGRWGTSAGATPSAAAR